MPPEEVLGDMHSLDTMVSPLIDSRGVVELPMVDRTRRIYEAFPIERICFICLDGTEVAEDQLVSCCSRCYAISHEHCWAEWRCSQANHSRRARLAGNRIGSDPFLCSICKSGSARVVGETVSVRWLESFTNLARASTGMNVRFATGLFSALSGARYESSVRTLQTDTETGGESLVEDEVDFFDYMDSVIERGEGSFFCGNNRRFFLTNFLGIIAILIVYVIVSELGLADNSGTMALSFWILLYLYLTLLVGYMILKFEKTLTSRFFVQTDFSTSTRN